MLHKFAQSPLVLAFVWSGLIGCHNEAYTSSNLAHQRDQPFESLGAWNWQNLSVEEFLSGEVADPALVLAKNYLPLDHPMTQHLESRATSMFETLARAYPDALAHVPSPHVLVIKDPSFNAYAMAKDVCLENVSLEYMEGDKIFPSARISNGLVLRSFETGACLKRKATREEVEERIALNFPEGSSPTIASEATCRYEIEEVAGHFTVRFGPDCATPFGMDGVRRVEEIRVFTMTNWLTFNVGLLKSLSEDQVIAVLAHELAHYLRAHSITSVRFGQAYSLKNPSEAPLSRMVGTPFPKENDEILRSVELALRAAERDTKLLYNTFLTESLYASLGIHAPIREQKYHTAFATTLVGLAKAADEHHCNKSNSCNKSCAAAAVEGQEFADKELFLSPLTEDLRQRYLAFEKEAAACFVKTVIFDPSGSEPILDLNGSPSAFDPIALFFATDLETKLQTGTEKITLVDLLSVLNENAQLHAPAYSLERVGEYFAILDQKQKLEQKINAVSDAKDDLEKMINREHIGIFTTEQEADHLSLEFLAMVGIPPKTARDIWLAQNPLEKTTRIPCDELFSAGWRHQGQPFVVPIGTTEIHHQTCFRIFDLDQELGRHRYEDHYTMDAKLLPEDEWAMLVKNISSTMSPAASLARARAKLLTPPGTIHDHH